MKANLLVKQYLFINFPEIIIHLFNEIFDFRRHRLFYFDGVFVLEFEIVIVTTFILCLFINNSSVCSLSLRYMNPSKGFNFCNRFYSSHRIRGVNKMYIAL